MLEFKVNEDEGEKSLRPLLQAHGSYERTSTRRSFCVHALALASVFVWLGACWPSLLPAPVREFVNQCWGILFFISLVTVAEEWKWYRRLRSCVAKHPGAKLG